MRGWMHQLSARIATSWGNIELAEKMQKSAFSNNRNLTRPKVLPPYTPLILPNDQAEQIVMNLKEFGYRRGFLKSYEETVSKLNNHSSANQFEQASTDFAKTIGLQAERHDTNGEGSDVLWLLPDKIGFVIEAKSRKKDENPLNKEEHGQLLVAAEWFSHNYPQHKCVRISVHPQNLATKAASAGASHALTFKKLGVFISDA